MQNSLISGAGIWWWGWCSFSLTELQKGDLWCVFAQLLPPAYYLCKMNLLQDMHCPFMLTACVHMHKMPHFQLECVYSERMTYQGCQAKSPTAQENFPYYAVDLPRLWDLPICFLLFFYIWFQVILPLKLDTGFFLGGSRNKVNWWSLLLKFN